MASYGYDAQGRRTGIVRGNGTTTSYGYAQSGQDTPWLTSLAHNVAGGAKDVTTTFTYNPAGQIATSERSNDLYAYTAAINGRRGTTVNGLNQATQVGSAALSYDANGNTTAIGGSAYTYTPENGLRTGPSEPNMVYDGFGQLFSIQSEGTILRSVGGEVVAEHDAANSAIKNRYVSGASVDEPLVWYGGSGTGDRHWLIADERGSIVASTGPTGVAAINTYDEYGVPAASNVGRFGYTGQYWLPSVGLWYYKARMYAPALGRFMQTDPIGYGGGMNLYGYVGGDPVNARDPAGLGCFYIGSRLPQPCRFGEDADPYESGNGGGGDKKGSNGGGRWVPSKSPTGAGLHRSTSDNGQSYKYYYIPFVLGSVFSLQNGLQLVGGLDAIEEVSSWYDYVKRVGA